jgi:hypothetical protein
VVRVHCAIGAGLYWVATKAVLPLITRLPTIPGPQFANVLLSLAVTLLIVGLVTWWAAGTFKRARNAVIAMTDSRISELARVLEKTVNRVRYLESQAASVGSTNNAFSKLNERIVPMERRPDDLRGEAALQQWALARLLNSPSANSVGHALTIHEATYGVDGGQRIDVRAVLERSIKDNRIRMTVTNDSMGRDPQWGAPKRLWVRYSCDDRTYEIGERR